MKKLGVIGGMGPLATVDFYKRIIEHDKAEKDQDHIDMIILNHASMIDRTYALTNGLKNELLSSLKDDIKTLENAGVNNIVIPCNTCHTIYKDIQTFTNIPIINMVEETVKYICENRKKYQKIGLMATTGTINSNMYQDLFKKHHLELFVPDKDTQKEIMQIIYNEIKSNGIYSSEHFEKVLEVFKENGCSHVILGCTELSGFKDKYSDISIDPMDYLVRTAILQTGGTYQ